MDNKDILLFYKDLIDSGEDELIISVGELEFKLFDIDAERTPIFKFKSYSPGDINFSVGCIESNIYEQVLKQLRFLGISNLHFNVVIYDGDALINYYFYFYDGFVDEIYDSIKNTNSITYNFRLNRDFEVDGKIIPKGSKIYLEIDVDVNRVVLEDNGSDDLYVTVFLKPKKAIAAILEVKKGNIEKEYTMDWTSDIVTNFNDMLFPDFVNYVDNNFNRVYDFFQPPYFEYNSDCFYFDVYPMLEK
jgi:hypothetical protein